MTRAYDTKTIGAAFATLLMATLFVVTLIHATAFAPDPDESMDDASIGTTSGSSIPAMASKQPAPEQIPASNLPIEKPSRLSIPSLNIDANVQHVGIGKSGNMAVPNNFTDVGWYRYGTIPGQPGSAVMDGHVDNGLALAGVFKYLRTIKKGSEIYVITEKGSRIRFLVTDIAAYDYTDKSVDKKVFSGSGGSLLYLITCTGDWVPGNKTYDHRLIVTAQLAQ
ncbi:MAG: class sortase [Candidatus Taylorbacteria bacterium]|nr:class sortase [Candidatus Taylorbacteria bacterium]